MPQFNLTVNKTYGGSSTEPKYGVGNLLYLEDNRIHANIASYTDVASTGRGFTDHQRFLSPYTPASASETLFQARMAILGPFDLARPAPSARTGPGC